MLCRNLKILAMNGVRHKMLYSTLPTEPPIMKQLREDLKEAMRNKETSRKDALRSVMAAVKNANIEKAGSVVSDLALYDLVSSSIGKREKSVQEYAAAKREDLVSKEKEEISVLEKLLLKIPVATDEQVSAKILELAMKLGVDVNEPNSKKQLMSKIPWKDVESQWNASRKLVTRSVLTLTSKREYSTLATRATMRPRFDQRFQRSFSKCKQFEQHENPFGIIGKKKGKSVGFIKKKIPSVSKIVAISSAKGGVGKSTVAVNLALSLFEKGLSVGILDVDIFGPSIPKLLNLSGEPEVNEVNYGIKAMSMGFLVDPSKAVAWRGLLVQKALQQLMFDVEWGQLDVLIMDMPPGTGDVQLTMVQQLEIDGAIVISTPQDLALIDAVRGIDLFKTVHVPIIGMIQNMSFFVCPNCNHQSHVFGTDGVVREAHNRGLRLLGDIPLSLDISTSSDSGKPIVAAKPESPASLKYLDIASSIRQFLGV